MPKVLEADEIDPVTEEVDLALTQEEERAFAPVSPTQVFQDLSDGGRVGDAILTPRQNGKKMPQGRATVRRAWTWNGSESMLPLAWNPAGTRHDGARHYLLKRFCLCCHIGGFRGQRCPNCIKNNCIRCASSTDRRVQELGNGQKVQGWIVPCFYLKKEQVPFPARFFGTVDCFLDFCVRRGEFGFLDEQTMRVHARSRHRTEYQAYIETQQAAKEDEVGTLRKQVATLMSERRSHQRARKAK